MVGRRGPPLILDPRRWALFVDVDGTLVAIADRPDHVRVENSLKALLQRLGTRLGGALAVITGRRIADIDRLFEPLRLAVSGVHGAERRDAAGRWHDAGPVVSLAGLLPPIEAFARSHDGILVEDKGASLAVHYRQAPDAEPGLRVLIAELVEGRPGLRAIDGKRVIELRPRGFDKGRAIGAFMDEPPFAGRRPVFIGDDVTDEDGFAAVEAMDGMTIRVGENAPTAARYRLENVAAVLDWLTRVAEAPATLGPATPGEDSR